MQARAEEALKSWGAQDHELYITDEMIVYILVTDSVQSTLSMHSMLLVGGSGACPPGNF